MMRLVYAYLLVGLSLSSALHAEPPTNPELGNTDTRYVLEIFTASDCGACAKLHREFIAMFPNSPLSKVLRLRVRTVFSPNLSGELDEFSKLQFCLQVSPNWFLYYGRQEIPVAIQSFSSTVLRRFNRCLEDPRVEAVMRFNRTHQRATGILGVPGFRLLENGIEHCESCVWQGFRSGEFLIQQIEQRLVVIP